ncbi:hypothetical protein EG830_08705, partial [bacterium]|nr:hypothetical protein [bacterium]
MRKDAAYLALCIFMVLSTTINGQKAGLEFENQVSTWLGMSFPDEVKWQSGIRYIPTLSPWVKAGTNGKFDAEFSANTFGSLHLTGSNLDSSDFRVKPYRLWFRYSTSHLEIRAGLQ